MGLDDTSGKGTTAARVQVIEAGEVFGEDDRGIGGKYIPGRKPERISRLHLIREHDIK